MGVHVMANVRWTTANTAAIVLKAGPGRIVPFRSRWTAMITSIMIRVSERKAVKASFQRPPILLLPLLRLPPPSLYWFFPLSLVVVEKGKNIFGARTERRKGNFLLIHSLNWRALGPMLVKISIEWAREPMMELSKCFFFGWAQQWALFIARRAGQSFSLDRNCDKMIIYQSKWGVTIIINFFAAFARQVGSFASVNERNESRGKKLQVQSVIYTLQEPVAIDGFPEFQARQKKLWAESRGRESSVDSRRRHVRGTDTDQRLGR